MKKSMVVFLCLSLFFFSACAGTPITPGTQTTSRTKITFPLNSNQNLTGDLSKPEGDGPFPAVIFLPGCTGGQYNLSGWEKILVKEKYVTFGVDSLGPRGVNNVCSNPEVDKPTSLDRVSDAFAAKHYLETLPFIDKERMAAIGFSHGAMTALIMALYPSASEKPFREIIAFYPYCFPIDPSKRALSSPLMILIGGNDDWCPAKLCEAYPEILKGLNHEVVLKVYPGAYHAFDNTASGLLEFMGHKLGRDESASADSIVMVKNFLHKYFNK
ncbi:MAG: dienelactone hydrolase family protein [Thermodesulfobacteriota bacterium]